MKHIAYPLQFDGHGTTKTSGQEQYIRDLIEQILITSPGERVMRPDFGSSVHQLVFAPNSRPLAVAIEMSIQGAINQYLGDLIQASEVVVERDEEKLYITIRYIIRTTGAEKTETFSRAAP